MKHYLNNTMDLPYRTPLYYGLHIISMFKKNIFLNQSFSAQVSILKSAFPTKYNQNKFIVGMGVEKIFAKALNCELLDKNELRNDISYNGYKYSIKYSTPNKERDSINNIRLINKRTVNNDKEYFINEDTFIILSNSNNHGGLLIFIPYEIISKDDLKISSDGIDIKGKSIIKMIKKYPMLCCTLQIQSLKDEQEIDIIQLAVDSVMERLVQLENST